MKNRIGIGYDAHRFSEGRPLILGGVEVPHEKGLLGHSDADALCHAISDALLGAANLGDMGRHFPDNDPKWEGADSLKMLAECAKMVRSRGFTLGNVDAVIVCQRPKLAPHLPAMQEKVAQALSLGKGYVSLKAKTTEGMGFEGREEGLSVQAVALLEMQN